MKIKYTEIVKDSDSDSVLENIPWYLDYKRDKARLVREIIKYLKENGVCSCMESYFYTRKEFLQTFSRFNPADMCGRKYWVVFENNEISCSDNIESLLNKVTLNYINLIKENENE